MWLFSSSVEDPVQGEPPQLQSAPETESATLAALRGLDGPAEEVLASLMRLKELSLLNPSEVGSLALSDLVDHFLVVYNPEAREEDESNHADVLEILTNLVMPEKHDHWRDNLARLTDCSTDVWISRITKLLSLATKKDIVASFEDCYHSLQLLTCLAMYNCDALQSALLAIHEGVNGLCLLLASSVDRMTHAEVANDEASQVCVSLVRDSCLVLLTCLCRDGNNPSTKDTLRKLIAFEDMFDHLFSLMLQEWKSLQSVALWDSLELTKLLLLTDTNQKYFVESGGLTKLTPLIECSAAGGAGKLLAFALASLTQVLAACSAAERARQSASSDLVSRLLTVVADCTLPEQLTESDTRLWAKRLCLEALALLVEDHALNQGCLVNSTCHFRLSEREEVSMSGIVLLSRLSVGNLLAEHSRIRVQYEKCVDRGLFAGNNGVIELMQPEMAELANRVLCAMLSSNEQLQMIFAESLSRRLSHKGDSKLERSPAPATEIAVGILSEALVSTDLTRVDAVGFAHGCSFLSSCLGNGYFGLRALGKSTVAWIRDTAVKSARMKRERHCDERIIVGVLLIVISWLGLDLRRDEERAEALALLAESKELMEWIVQSAADEKEESMQRCLSTVVICLCLLIDWECPMNGDGSMSVFDALTERVGFESAKSTLSKGKPEWSNVMSEAQRRICLETESRLDSCMISLLSEMSAKVKRAKEQASVRVGDPSDRALQSRVDELTAQNSDLLVYLSILHEQNTALRAELERVSQSNRA